MPVSLIANFRAITLQVDVLEDLPFDRPSSWTATYDLMARLQKAIANVHATDHLPLRLTILWGSGKNLHLYHGHDPRHLVEDAVLKWFKRISAAVEAVDALFEEDATIKYESLLVFTILNLTIDEVKETIARRPPLPQPLLHGSTKKKLWSMKTLKRLVEGFLIWIPKVKRHGR